MAFRIGRTEWPSFSAWAEEVVLCIGLRRHEWSDTHACLRCGIVGGGPWRPESPMELYARMDTPVYAHVKVDPCGCVTAWDVKAERYVEVNPCTNHGEQ